MNQNFKDSTRASICKYVHDQIVNGMAAKSMTFKRGDWVAYQNGHGLHGSDYEGTGKVQYVQEMDGDDELFLEDHNGIGSGIHVWAKDCKLKGAAK